MAAGTTLDYLSVRAGVDLHVGARVRGNCRDTLRTRTFVLDVPSGIYASVRIL